MLPKINTSAVAAARGFEKGVGATAVAAAAAAAAVVLLLALPLRPRELFA